MKFNKTSQLVLVASASLLVAGLITACSSTLTADFVFITSAKAAGTNSYGEIDVMEVNSESGAMRRIPTSPFPSGGRDPVAEAVSTDNTTLYVVNRDDNTIVQFAIGNDGKVYPQNTVNTPGVFPMALAVSGTNLFVLDTYQPLATCSTANPCSGAVALFPINTSNADSLDPAAANGSLSYWPLSLTSSPNDVLTPTALNVVTQNASTFLFVSATDTTTSQGYIFGFTVTAGSLTPLASGPFAAGTNLSALASDPNGNYLYATDSSNGDVLGYSVASSGALTALSGSPFAAGNQPSAITLDPTGNYVFVANAVDSTLSVYATSNGVLSSIGTYPTSTQPVTVMVDPSTGHYVYTANFLGSSVSGFQLDTTTSPASLLSAMNTPYTVNALPTAMVAITHGKAVSTN